MDSPSQTYMKWPLYYLEAKIQKTPKKFIKRHEKFTLNTQSYLIYFELVIVALAWFANEPISMMAATFQSDINHQSQVGAEQKIKHTRGLHHRC